MSARVAEHSMEQIPPVVRALIWVGQADEWGEREKREKRGEREKREKLEEREEQDGY
jgi:hypothetical protein